MGSIGEKRPFEKVLIVGAGPAGLLLALLLSQNGIASTVLESWSGLDPRLRASQYGVPATRIFRRAGILDDIRAVSIESFPYICWRKISNHERLIGVDLSVIKDHPDRMTVLPLSEITKIIYRHCMERGNGLIEVKFDHEVVDIGQDSGKAWADVVFGESAERTRFSADYLVGCDGGKSVVRHLLFGRSWPGISHDCHLMVQNVWYDGFEKHGWDGGNYMCGPEFWGLAARRGKGGLWRVTYGDVAGLSDEEYEQRRPKAFKKLLPGHPGPENYEVTQTDHFRIHNRCVDKMRVGRIFLAGDAAHVCNPFGGYGAMTAIIDVGALADCLIGVYGRKAGDEILDLYADIRREKFLKYVDARSLKNMKRISKDDPETLLEKDKLLGIFQELESNPEATKDFLLKYSSIEYDFTQHYS